MLKKILSKRVIIIFVFIVILLFILVRNGDIKASKFTVFDYPEFLIIDGEYYFQKHNNEEVDYQENSLGYALYNKSIAGRFNSKEIFRISDMNVAFDGRILYEKATNIKINDNHESELFIICNLNGGFKYSISSELIKLAEKSIVKMGLSFPENMDNEILLFPVYVCSEESSCSLISYIFKDETNLYYGNLENIISTEYYDHFTEIMVKLLARVER